MKKILGLLTLLFITQHLSALPSPHWSKIKTGHFTFIFKENNKAVAGELITFSEDIYGKLSEYFDYYPTNINCVIIGGVDHANGYFSPLPAAVYLHATPPTTPESLGASTENRMKLLLIHELTHFFHITLKKGPASFFSPLFGAPLATAPAYLSPAGWIIEGITTNMETIHTKGGRGRNLFFEMQYKAPVLEDKLFTPKQANYSSGFPPFGRIYVAGYILTDYLIRNYGENSIIKIITTYLNNPLAGFYPAIKKVTGRSYTSHFYEMKQQLKEKFREDALIPPGIRLSPGEAGRYYLPVKTDAGLYQYKSSLGIPAGIFHIDPATGSESLLLKTYITDPASLSADRSGSVIYFASRAYDYTNPFYESTLSSLYSLNPVTKHIKQITRDRSTWQPVVSMNGERLFAVQKEGLYSYLVEVNPESGTATPLFREKETHVYYPSLSPDGKKLAFVLNTRGMQDIFLIDLQKWDTAGRVFSAPDIIPVTGPDYHNEYYPSFTDATTLIYSSDRENRLILYSHSLLRDEDIKICEDPVGAYKGYISGNEVIYGSYSSEGYCVKSKPLGETETVLPPLPTAQVPPPFQWLDTPESRPYTDRPAFLYWFPYPDINFADLTDINPAVYLTGDSILGINNWTSTLVFKPEYMQPVIQFTGRTTLDKARFAYNFSHGFTDATGNEEHPQFSQIITNRISLSYPLYSVYALGKANSISLSGSISYDYRLMAPGAFPFLNGFNFDIFSYNHILRSAVGLSFVSSSFNSLMDYYSPGLFLAIINAGFPLYAALAETPGKLAITGKTAWHIPGPFRHHVIKPGLKVSYITQITGEPTLTLPVISPRGSFPHGYQEQPGRLIWSLDWLFPVAYTDTPLIFGVNLTRVGAGFHLEAIAEYGAVPPALTHQRVLYAGLELHGELVYANGSFPVCLGVSTRFDPTFQTPFDYKTDIRGYYSSGFNSF